MSESIANPIVSLVKYSKDVQEVCGMKCAYSFAVHLCGKPSCGKATWKNGATAELCEEHLEFVKDCITLPQASPQETSLFSSSEQK